MDVADMNTEISRPIDELTGRIERLDEQLPMIRGRAIRLIRATAWSEADLYEGAQELVIDGRNSMSKREPVRALRSA